MIRASKLGSSVFLAASAALSACDIPPATFDAAAGGTTTNSAGGTTATGSMGGGGTTTPMHTTSAGGSTGGTTTTGGTGGTGATGGIGGTTTTTTTSSGGAVVPCNYPVVSDCNPGQVCCFQKTGADPVDFCAGPGECDPPTKYAELKCNENADCTGGKVCCAFYALDPDQQYRVQKTYCDIECLSDEQEISTCTDSSCQGASICTELFGSAYPDYKFCISF